MPAVTICRFLLPPERCTRRLGISTCGIGRFTASACFRHSFATFCSKPNLENYGYGWGILVPEPGAPYAGEPIPMHGGAIFGFQSVIRRIPQHKELIVLLDNTDSPKLLDIALDIRRILSENRG